MPLHETHTHHLKNGISIDLAHLPKGTFFMGSDAKEAFDNEKPVHEVAITRDFYLGTYPVTQAVWLAVMGGENPSYFKGMNRPVERVSWLDIMEGDPDQEGSEGFLQKLNREFPVTDPELRGYQFRLPTEAEWEYAARAGQPCTYAGSNKLKEVGWYTHNSHGETKPVGLKKPNAWGLYDMSGNIYEWCQDWFKAGYYKDCFRKGTVEDPHGPDSGPYRVFRGGGFVNTARFCRVSNRFDNLPPFRYPYVGFRLVLAPVSVDRQVL